MLSLFFQILAHHSVQSEIGMKPMKIDFCRQEAAQEPAVAGVEESRMQKKK